MTGQEYNFNKLTEDDVHSLGQAYDCKLVPLLLSFVIYLTSLHDRRLDHALRQEHFLEGNLLGNHFACRFAWKEKTGNRPATQT